MLLAVLGQAARARRSRSSPLARYILAPVHIALAGALVLSWVMLLGSGPHGDRWWAKTRADGADVDASSLPLVITRFAALATSASR